MSYSNIFNQRMANKQAQKQRILNAIQGMGEGMLNKEKEREAKEKIEAIKFLKQQREYAKGQMADEEKYRGMPPEVAQRMRAQERIRQANTQSTIQDGQTVNTSRMTVPEITTPDGAIKQWLNDQDAARGLKTKQTRIATESAGMPEDLAKELQVERLLGTLPPGQKKTALQTWLNDTRSARSAKILKDQAAAAPETADPLKNLSSELKSFITSQLLSGSKESIPTLIERFNNNKRTEEVGAGAGTELKDAIAAREIELGRKLDDNERSEIAKEYAGRKRVETRDEERKRRLEEDALRGSITAGNLRIEKARKENESAGDLNLNDTARDVSFWGGMVSNVEDPMKGKTLKRYSAAIHENFRRAQQRHKLASSGDHDMAKRITFIDWAKNE